MELFQVLGNPVVQACLSCGDHLVFSLKWGEGLFKLTKNVVMKTNGQKLIMHYEF